MDRRVLLKRSSVVGAAGLASMLATAAPAEAGTDSRHACPTGTWALDVTLVELGRHEKSHYAFTGDGIAIHVSNNGLLGLGDWRASGRTAFALSLREFVLATDGTVEGELRVHLDCTLTSSTTLTATGTGRAFDLSGNLLYTVHSTATGTKFGLE